jgi:rubredoxin
MNDVPDSWMCEACNGPLVLIGVLGSREHARCRMCGLDHNRAVVELDEGSDEPDVDVEIAAGAFDDAILTRPGEDIIARVEEERQADLERFSNDLKGR